MIRVLTTAFILAAAPVAAQTDNAQHPEVIYGDDDRLDLYQVKTAKLLQMADSTVGLFSSHDVNVDGEKAKLSLRSYSQRYSLCPEEPFYEQSTGAFCSGSLIGPDLIMTAGHCVTSQQACESTKFVFGFAIKKAGELPTTVAAEEVYGCAKLLDREQVNSGADWALIKLDRPVPNHAPLALDLSPVANGQALVVIGHPAGLPTKVAGGASVRDASPNGFYVANLDTYGGNSGSAVFNAVTGKINGILVRGEVDYVWKNGCRVSNVCADTACRGEDVTKLGAVRFSATDSAGPRLATFEADLPLLLERHARALR